MPIHPNLHISSAIHSDNRKRLYCYHQATAGKRLSSCFFHYFLRSHTPRYPRIFSRTVKCRSFWFNAFAGCFAELVKKDDKNKIWDVLQAHPKRIPEAEKSSGFSVRMYSVLILSSFFAYALQAPEAALNQELLHLTSPRKPIQDNFRFPYPLLSHPPLSAVLLYT